MDQSNHRHRFNNTLFKCVYAVVVTLTTTPTLAQEAPAVSNIAGPSATATGNVTNQAVQVLQGPFAVNTYGGGVQCQGPTMNITPFIMGARNYSWDPETYETGSGNMGLSLGFNFPLDGSLQERCKAAVDAQIASAQLAADKTRLDFELVRLLRCGEAMKAGVRFHPDSPYAAICADVVVIQPPPPPPPEPKPGLN